MPYPTWLLPLDRQDGIYALSSGKQADMSNFTVDDRPYL